MLVSHRKRFIYTKTIKTAGTSVESYFEKYCVPEGSWQFSHARAEQIGEAGIIGYRGRGSKEAATYYNHMPAAEIKELLGEATWNRYFKFCVIRNPFDKLVSHFYYLVRKEMIDPGLLTGDEITSFRNWLKQGGCIIDRDKYLIGGRVCLDYFIRYENLSADIKEVCAILEVPFEPEKLPRLKSGMRDHSVPLKDYYDNETIALVRKLYSFELNHFGYDFPA